MSGSASRKIPLAVTILALIAAFGCSERSDRYYRHVTLDGRFEYVGAQEIPEGDIGSVDCYHVSRDDDGRLEKIEHLTRGRPSPSSVLGGVAQVVFEYSDGLETRRYLTAEGQLHPRFDPARIELDEGGKRVAMSFAGESGRNRRGGVERYEWTVNADGYRTSSVRLDAGGERTTDSRGVCEVRWKYDPAGKMIEWANHGPQGGPVADSTGVAVKRYAHDDEGHRTALFNFGIDGRLVETPDGQLALGEPAACAFHRYLHDDNGYTTYDACFSADEKRIGHLEMDYDAGGFLLEKREFWSSSPDTVTRVVRYEYDTSGDLLTSTVYDSEGNIVTSR